MYDLAKSYELRISHLVKFVRIPVRLGS